MAKSRNLRFGIEICKVDAEQRLVEGWCSTDKKDKQNDRVPYTVMLATMERDADTLGIREMHQPKAIGVLKAWRGENEEKRVWIQVFLSESDDGENALIKCREGVLKGFSIGGRALNWTFEGSTRVITEMSLTEISLVDVPANPQAIITIVKSQQALDLEARRVQAAPNVVINNYYEKGDYNETDETTQVFEHNPERGWTKLPDESDQLTPVSVDCTYPTTAEITPDNIASVAQSVLEESTKLIEVAPGGVDKFVKAVEELKGLVGLFSEEKKAALERMETIGKGVGIYRRPDSPITAPASFSKDYKQYGDPANFGYPCDTEFNALSSVKLYNVNKGVSSYSPREWAVLGRRIARIAGETIGTKFNYDPINKRVEKEKHIMADKLEKASVAGLLGDVKTAVAAAVEAIGSDPEKARDMLTQALSALEVGADGATSAETAVSTGSGVSEVKGEGTTAPAVTAPTPTATATTKTVEPATATATPSMPEGVTHDVPSATATHTVATESTPESSPSEKTESETMAKFASMFKDAMKEVVDEVKKAYAPTTTGLPIGDLPLKSSPVPNPVREALESGNLHKAQEAAGEQNLYGLADSMTKDTISGLGINMQKFGIIDVNQPAPVK